MRTHTPSDRNYSSARDRAPRTRARQAEPSRRHNLRRDRGRFTYQQRRNGQAWLAMMVLVAVLLASALFQYLWGAVR